MDDTTKLSGLLQKFKVYSNKINNPCDFEEKSFDAMVYITGRNDWTDMGSGMSGYAYTKRICTLLEFCMHKTQYTKLFVSGHQQQLLLFI